MADIREIIARRTADFFEEGNLGNLGIGLPTLVANYLSPDKNVMLHSENGFIGIGPNPEPGKEDKDTSNAGGIPVTIVPGGACFDSSMSFALARGGHVDITVLGALEVDEHGDLANWNVPGKLVPGMGGAMDLVVGAKKVIIAMEHTTKDGSPKILKKCTLPLTAVKVVNFIVTELGVMEITDAGIVLKELAPGVTAEDIQSKTEAKLIIPDKIGVMYAQ
ncbi:MAG: 3-oxoacid CoA-transferase subunit B [Oscillospiraceae bacterium]|nr:3-oxoacid CoA-transferase subunit B [Oscillospiraceae bacterium]